MKCPACGSPVHASIYRRDAFDCDVCGRITYEHELTEDLTNRTSDDRVEIPRDQRDRRRVATMLEGNFTTDKAAGRLEAAAHQLVDALTNVQLPTPSRIEAALQEINTTAARYAKAWLNYTTEKESDNA